MIDHANLARDLRTTSIDLDRHGKTTWKRAEEWLLARMPSNGVRGGGMQGAASEDAVVERLQNESVGRYQPELDAITKRMTTDAARLRHLLTICSRDSRPSTLATTDMLAAQAAADGWCKSCFRDDQHLTPIAMRDLPNGQQAPIYRDLCRLCGEWKAAHGQLPPVSILAMRHNGRRVTTADVEKALARQ